MKKAIMMLEVWLNQTRVGSLTRLPGEHLIFGFDETYIADPKRSVLSQSYYDKLGMLFTDMRPTQVKAPTFFSNLLPEGILRDYLAQKAGIKPEHEFELLNLLGLDLPGSVVIKPSEAGSDHLANLKADEFDSFVDLETTLRFSLAGMQLKFSALAAHHGKLTIPAHGVGGDWIVKLPSSRFSHLPENEYSMLQLAKYIGIAVPDVHLMPIHEISGLPAIAYESNGNVLTIKRFDREGQERIHMEDFAQVYNVYPHRKYEGVSYNNIAEMVSAVSGETGMRDFVRRLIFNILIGNHDMHLKNWSLLYPDGQHPILAPAYDYVATHVYLPSSKMALSTAGERNAEKINQDLLKRFIQKAALPQAMILKDISETVEKTVSAWHTFKQTFPLSPAVQQQMERYLLKAAHLIKR